MGSEDSVVTPNSRLLQYKVLTIVMGSKKTSKSQKSAFKEEGNAPIMVRVKWEQRDAIVKAAAGANLKLATFVREAALAAAGRPELGKHGFTAELQEAALFRRLVDTSALLLARSRRPTKAIAKAFASVETTFRRESVEIEAAMQERWVSLFLAHLECQLAAGESPDGSVKIASELATSLVKQIEAINSRREGRG